MRHCPTITTDLQRFIKLAPTWQPSVRLAPIDIDPRALRQEVELERDLLKRIVSGPDVLPFGFRGTSARVIYPYYIVNGRSELIDPATLQQRFPLAYEYFERTRAALDSRDGGSAMGEQWYRYIRTQNISLQALPKLAIPRLVSRLKAAYERPGEYCLDNVDVGGVILKSDAPVSYEYILGLLNSRLLSFWFVRNQYPSGGNSTLQTGSTLRNSRLVPRSRQKYSSRFRHG